MTLSVCRRQMSTFPFDASTVTHTTQRCAHSNGRIGSMMLGLMLRQESKTRVFQRLSLTCRAALSAYGSEACRGRSNLVSGGMVFFFEK